MNAYAKTLFEADAEGFNFAVELDEVYTTAGDGYWSTASKDVRVTAMGTYVCTDEDEGAGDFYVAYDEATWDMDTDGLIYTDSEFLNTVQCKMREVLIAMGVDATKASELAGSITYSEQGMQDYGRVSFDAYDLQDFLRSFYSVLA